MSCQALVSTSCKYQRFFKGAKLSDVVFGIGNWKNIKYNITRQQGESTSYLHIYESKHPKYIKINKQWQNVSKRHAVQKTHRRLHKQSKTTPNSQTFR